MKSMLHEASTVTKAVEKAWIESGKPREFAITIHEQGKPGFLGFGSKPAIVSIQYDPSKQTVKTAHKREEPRHGNKHGAHQKDRQQSQHQKNNNRSEQKNHQDKQRRPSQYEEIGVPLNKNAKPEFKQQETRQERQPQQKQQLKQRDEAPVQRDVAQRNNDVKSNEPKQHTQQRQERQNAQEVQQQPRKERSSQHEHHDDRWTAELVADITQWTDELLKAMNIKSLYQITHDGRNLTVAFVDEELLCVEEPRHVAGAISYLLIQFLKKKHKKKFRGFHIFVQLPKTEVQAVNDEPSE